MLKNNYTQEEFDILSDTIKNDPAYFENHDVNETNEQGDNLLFYAYKHNDTVLAKELLEQGVDVNKLNFQNEHFLHIASSEEMTEFILSSYKLDKEKVFCSIIKDSRSDIYFNKNYFISFLNSFSSQIKNAEEGFLSDMFVNIYKNENFRSEEIIMLWEEFIKDNYIEYSFSDALLYRLANYESNMPTYIKNKTLIKLSDTDFEPTKAIIKEFFLDLKTVLKTKDDELVKNFISEKYEIIFKTSAPIFKKYHEDSSKGLDRVDINESNEIDYLFSSVYAIIKIHYSEIINGKVEYLNNYELYDGVACYSNRPSYPQDVSIIEDIVEKYGLAGIRLDKTINITSAAYLLEQQLNKVSETFGIKDIGHHKLLVQLISQNRLQIFKEHDTFGAFSNKCNSISISIPDIYTYNKNFLDIEVEKNLVSTFVHEYTHYLQHVSAVKRHHVFDKRMKKSWQEVKEQVYSIEYTSTQCISLITEKFVNEIEEKTPEIKNKIIKHLHLYFVNNQEKHIDNILNMHEFFKYNESYYKKLCKTVKKSYTEQFNNVPFYATLWKNLGDGKYFRNNFELHARFVEEFLLDTSINHMVEVMYYKPNNDAKQNIKNSLIKFNAMLIAHNEDFLNKKEKTSLSKNKI